MVFDRVYKDKNLQFINRLQCQVINFDASARICDDLSHSSTLVEFYCNPDA